MDLQLDAVPMTRTGLQVSEIAFGTWRFARETDQGRLEVDRETAADLLDTYAAAGGRFIDTADVYGDGESERWIGKWLRGRDRDEFVVASKVYFPTGDDPNAGGLNRKHVRRQVQYSLERLRTDYIDILYIHRWDEETPARELMRSLNALVEEGKVHHLGASTLAPNAWRIARANGIAYREGLEQFSVTQPRYNVVNREIEGEFLDFCRERGLDVASWSPLAQGFLTGKYDRDGGVPGDATASDTEGWEDRYLTEENFDALDVVRTVAEEVGATPAQVAIAWQLEHPQVTAPIVGARTVEQLEENLRAATVDLSADQFDRLSEAKAGPFEDLL
ncbi:aldo/keto reductase [Salinirussus salinus]|jgi:aryl-alcohol dehydrogenase-like predicted oxidoreductase|uniref:aldo/keto reductase n=1 Tax=Salinirussus salinus TaxID=1198300 RepID=UPI00135A4FBD|nr:aldo/keto reductase [Salinirussus salinus]